MDIMSSPIVGEQARLVGILTQSDLVKALGNHGS
jgi:CBS-domain-containing membrane protein